ncbi:hypothetical protein [Lewinella cohaerens]|uniref:hypothetical protein n=1 Tax=Lewinella cohaerens TaxID=70995 RepID=UPI0003615E7D|nr:hypothetical protein [Lewinella cohaerens]
MNKKLINVFLVLFMILNACHGRESLELKIIIKSDTVNQLQTVLYQIKWYNRSNDTVKIRDDWGSIVRPKIEVRKNDEKDWNELWRSNEELIRQCYLKRGSPLWCSYVRPRFFIIPPKESVVTDASYFPMPENMNQPILTPGNTYEFRFIVPEVLSKWKISQKTDLVYISFSTRENQALLAKMIDFDLNPYDLFKSWNSCSKDSSVVRRFQELSVLHPNSDISELVQLKVTEWDWLTLSNEDFSIKYSKKNLFEQLSTLKAMLKSEFYDEKLIREMIYENLERGLKNGYSIDEYFDNMEFADGD